jgi:hypothetical protein
VTRLRKMMLEELQRRNYSQHTTRYYIRTVEDLLLLSGTPSGITSSSFMETSHCSLSPAPSPPGYGHCSERTGWSTRNHLSVAPSMFSSIWAATLTVWPSPTIAWSPSPMAKSLFAGVILLTTTNRSCCPYRSMNSCAASYCTSFPKASCASVTSASWPTAGAPRSYRFAFSCWVRNNSRKPNNTPRPPKTVPIFGAALNAVDR